MILKITKYRTLIIINALLKERLGRSCLENHSEQWWGHLKQNKNGPKY